MVNATPSAGTGARGRDDAVSVRHDDYGNDDGNGTGGRTSATSSWF